MPPGRPAKRTATSDVPQKPKKRRRHQEKVVCQCCGELISQRQEQRHRAAQVPRLSGASTSRSPLFHNPYAVESSDDEEDDEGEEVHNTAAPSSGLSDSSFVREMDEDSTNINDAPNISHRVTVEDITDDEDDDNDDTVDRELDRENGIDWYQELPDDDDDDDVDTAAAKLDRGLSIDELLHEKLEQELAETGYEITKEELATLRHYAFKVERHLTLDDFAALPYAFTQENVASWKTTKALAESFSHIEPEVYDCCINSCICYVGPHADETLCQYCKEPRYRPGTMRARKHFVYIPLIPRLIGFYRSLSMIDKLRYRGAFKSTGNMTDIFDGSHYQSLCGTPVTIDGETMTYNFFSDIRDFCLGLSTDGFAPWRRRKKTCWPLLIYDYNLPPEIRFHLEYILCIGVIPGPKKPKDFDSFAWPLVQEMLKLARGVTAFDIERRESFILRAYLMVMFGDIPAVSMVMRMKGHNGVRPCRMCNIEGVAAPEGKVYYVPLDRSNHPKVQASPSAIRKYDARNLPMRNHAEMKAQAEEVQFARNTAQSERLSKQYGIKGTSIFMALSSLSFPTSFPYDFMHLVFENVLKNLALLWSGSFKDLDEGTGSYEFEKKVWEAIGAATAAAGSTIPSCFGARPPDIADDKQATTADSWSFWLLYLGPVLLEHKFTSEVYYVHFLTFSTLVQRCMQYECSKEDITEIRDGFIAWVLEYERLYYQHSPARSSACPLTIHALLHIADMIKTMGPVWAYWAFPTERYCGRLQPAIKSKRYPFANIDNYLISYAHLSQIKTVYGLEKELSLRPSKSDVVKGQFSDPGYPDCVLIPPQRPSSTVSAALHKKIIIAFATRFNCKKQDVAKFYRSESVVRWAKVRRLNGGDDMLASTLAHHAEDRRDATFVRYDMLIDKNATKRRLEPNFEEQQFFGQLEDILVVTLPAAPPLGLLKPSTYILAVIKSCTVVSVNRLAMPSYTTMRDAVDVVDMTCVQCLVGRIPKSSREHTLLDRSGTIQRSFYVPGE